MSPKKSDKPAGDKPSKANKAEKSSAAEKPNAPAKPSSKGAQRFYLNMGGSQARAEDVQEQEPTQEQAQEAPQELAQEAQSHKPKELEQAQASVAGDIAANAAADVADEQDSFAGGADQADPEGEPLQEEQGNKRFKSLTGLLSVKGISVKNIKEKVSNYFNSDTDQIDDIKTVGEIYAEHDRRSGKAGALGIDPLSRLGILVVITGIGGVFLWSIFATIGAGVIATGVVSADSQRKLIQHLEGGIVTGIYAKEGDLVEEGELLLELDQTRSRAEFNLLQTRYFTELGNLSRLNAEMNGSEGLTVDEEISNAVNGEKIKAATIEGILAVQNTLFRSKRELQLGEKEILEARVAQIARQIKGLTVQLDAKKHEISLLDGELTKMRELSNTNIVDLSRVLQREREMSQANGELGRIGADIAVAEVQAGEARLRILQIDREIRQQAAEGILQTQEKIYDLRERLVANESVLARTQIKSPQAGYVIGQTAVTVGGVVSPGTPIMEIVPLEDTLVIEARINSTDVDNVEIGKEAEVKLSAFSQRGLPALYGKVITLSADAVVDNETGLAFYRAKISMPETQIADLGLELVPGMPAEVLIKGKTRSAFSYFTEPLTSFMFRGLNEE